MLARCSARVHACSASASRNLASATSMDEEEELKVESALEVLGLGVLCSGLLPTPTDMAVKCWSVRALLSAGDSGSPLDKVASMPDDSNGSGVQPVGSIVHRGACQRTTADNLCFGFWFAQPTTRTTRERKRQRADHCSQQAKRQAVTPQAQGRWHDPSCASAAQACPVLSW